MSRYCFATTILLVLCICEAALTAEPLKYLRFQKGDKVAYGLLEGSRVRELSGDLFGAPSKTATTYALSEVKLLPPTKPSQVSCFHLPNRPRSWHSPVTIEVI